MGGCTNRGATSFARKATVAFVLALAALFSGCAVPPSVRSPSPVAIVVSDRLPAYQQVVDVLNVRLEKPSIHVLDGDSRRAAQILAKLREHDSPIVAIGSLATRTVAGLPNRSIVYCQDLSAEDGRPSAAARGVRAMPPPYKQLQAWKMLDPRLQRVTLIRGAGNGEFSREAQAAAQLLKIRLDTIEVQNDREVLYAVKHLDADVQGIWFAPDSRVLSSDVLREALAHGLRQGKQSLVFSPQLLSLGALLSVEGDPSDIAERVVEQLRDDGSLPRVASLQRARTRINLEVARQLGLPVPPQMQAGTYVF